MSNVYDAAPSAGELAKNNMHQIQWKDGEKSSVGIQLRKEYYKKGAMIEAVKEQYFQPLASVTAMPKHYGRKIKQYQFLPLLDDRNMNDQGIDATGAYATKLNAKTNNNPDGNLYGSSKDIGLIVDRLPLLSETGGRVNRVGYRRQVIEGSFEDVGFYHEFTKDSMDFDTMDDLYQHMSRELVRGANQITEDVLQIDLINGAGNVRYSGLATSKLTMGALEIGKGDVVTYDDLQRLSIDLDNADCPRHTKMITGSRMVDTVTVGGGRIMYIGSEMIPSFTKMTDFFGNPAFVEVQQYAYAGDYKKQSDMIFGEIGKVGAFRIVVVPKMLNFSGQGAEVLESNHFGFRYSKQRKANASGAGIGGSYEAAKDAWNVYPCLVVGSESFTTIGFASGGDSFKFKIITQMPGDSQANRDDPYGRTGFASIQWYYGTMVLRPERLAVIYSLAEL